jgi:hypothetical protein
VAAPVPEPSAPPAAPAPPRRPRRAARSLAILVWLVVVLAAAAALVADLAGMGPGQLDDAGAVVVATAYTWGLAARTGGRTVLFSVLTSMLGAVVALTDVDVLRSGAAVVTAVLAAVFAVMVTVPVRSVLGAAREVMVATAVAAVGSLATLAWAPVVALDRFQYAVLGLSLVAAFITVSRLGVGLHGLGGRGFMLVLAGGVVLALTLGYAELLRRYGSDGLVDTLDDWVRWSHHHLGAFPRPIIALLGVPAIAWGTHMRARRRQGWWVCAFGVALTAPVAYALVDPGRSIREVALATAYGVLIGLVIGAVLIGLDLRLSRGRGRRLAEPDPTTAVRPEPGRTHALW